MILCEKLKGLVWSLLKGGSIKRALKLLQNPPGAAPHFQGRLLHQATSQGRILLGTGKILNGKGIKVEAEPRYIQTRDKTNIFQNGSSFFFRKIWKACPSPSAEAFRGLLEMIL